MIQGSDEWRQARAGKVTASCISKVMAQGRGGAPSATRATYLSELLTERLTGQPCENDYQSAAMRQGNEREAQARAVYELVSGNKVEEVGFIDHPTIDQAGCSPDGIIRDGNRIVGGCELKCPEPKQHLATLKGAPPKGEYLKQITFNLACTGADWWDFSSFNPDFPEKMQIKTIRIKRDAGDVVGGKRSTDVFVRSGPGNEKPAAGIWRPR